MKNKKQILFLCAVVLLGGILRFIGINWDSGYHLHPDERFLTMVSSAMMLPNSFAEYLDPNLSLFNPTNINFSFFVYGIFPLTLNKILAILLNNDSYDKAVIQGRILSGFFDLFVIIFVFKTAKLFEKDFLLHHSIKYLSSFFYAIAVLPIQLSHYFTVDSFLNLFMLVSFYFAYQFRRNLRIVMLILSALFLGLSIASKINALFIFPLNILLLLLAIFVPHNITLTNIHLKELLQKVNRRIFLRKIVYFFFCFLTYIIVIYIFTRLADPYIFQTNNFLDPQLNVKFINSLKELKSYENPNAMFPPAVQWLHTPPILYSLFNLSFFGVGLFYFIFILIGASFIIIKHRKTDLLLLLLWVIGFFIYQSSQFSKTTRYFIFLIPFLSIFAAIGYHFLVKNTHRIIQLIALCSILFWPLSFFSIYMYPNSRVTASEWIYKNIPDKSVLLTEHWDDPLPLLMSNNLNKSFITKQLPVFAPDTNEKWQEINTLLEKGNYIILSSNRGWGSIPKAPERYPKMKKFYEDLLGDKLSYKKIIIFSSYPSLRYLGIPLEIPDDISDESFTVYDHPKVIIFKKE